MSNASLIIEISTFKSLATSSTGVINQPLGCKKSIILIAIVLIVESLKSILIWLTRCSRKEILFSKVFSITSPAEVVLEDFIISFSDKFLFSRLKSDDR